jgi:hypothetical protein
MRASSVVKFMRDPLDLCFQPAFALTPYTTADDGCDVGHRFVDWNCRLMMYERVDDRCDQLGAMVLSGTSHNEGHVEETARLIQVTTTIGIGFCCIASALVGNVDSSCGGSAGECETCAHYSVLGRATHDQERERNDSEQRRSQVAPDRQGTHRHKLTSFWEEAFGGGVAAPGYGWTVR